MTTHPARLAELLRSCHDVLSDWSQAVLTAAEDAGQAVARTDRIGADLNAIAQRLDQDSENAEREARRLQLEIQRVGSVTTRAVSLAQDVEQRGRQLLGRSLGVLQLEEANQARAEQLLGEAQRRLQWAVAELDAAEAQVRSAVAEVAAASAALSACQSRRYYDRENQRWVEPYCGSEQSALSAAQSRLTSARTAAAIAAGIRDQRQLEVNSARDEVERCRERVKLARQALNFINSALPVANSAARLADQAAAAQCDAVPLGHDAAESARAAVAAARDALQSAGEVTDLGAALVIDARQLRVTAEEHGELSRRSRDILADLEEQLRAYDQPAGL